MKYSYGVVDIVGSMLIAVCVESVYLTNAGNEPLVRVRVCPEFTSESAGMVYTLMSK
jgi:hypothetical protein